MVSHFFGLAFSFRVHGVQQRKNDRIRDRNPFTERCAAPLLCLKKRQGPVPEGLESLGLDMAKLENYHKIKLYCSTI